MKQGAQMAVGARGKSLMLQTDVLLGLITNLRTCIVFVMTCFHFVGVGKNKSYERYSNNRINTSAVRIDRLLVMFFFGTLTAHANEPTYGFNAQVDAYQACISDMAWYYVNNPGISATELYSYACVFQTSPRTQYELIKYQPNGPSVGLSTYVFSIATSCPAGTYIDNSSGECVPVSIPIKNLGNPTPLPCSANADNKIMFGNPINIGTGNKYQPETD